MLLFHPLFAENKKDITYPFKRLTVLHTFVCCDKVFVELLKKKSGFFSYRNLKTEENLQRLSIYTAFFIINKMNEK